MLLFKIKQYNLVNRYKLGCQVVRFGWLAGSQLILHNFDGSGQELAN